MSDRPISPRSPRVALEPEKMPPPPRRSRSVRHPLVIAGNALMMIIVIVFIAAGAAYIYGKQFIDAEGPLQQDKVVNIPSNLRINDINELLQREGVIASNRIMFLGSVIALKARTELKSGEYLFPKGASLRSVIETMVEGKVVQHALTIPEGLTSQQIVTRLLESDVLTGRIREIPREGTLLPETYKFTRGMTREHAIQRMQQAQRRLVRDIWERRNADLPLKTPEELVILASIVEKETGRADERSRVAAVFVNRLQKKMRLQSDPTIVYGLVGGKGVLGHSLTRSEINQPTPYNTYVIDGLPPGPIANPGRASLEAAANPARTRDLYFVADGNGGHTFSETYGDHQKNVGKLREIERQQKGAPGNNSSAGGDDPAKAVEGGAEKNEAAAQEAASAKNKPGSKKPASAKPAPTHQRRRQPASQPPKQP